MTRMTISSSLFRADGIDWLVFIKSEERVGLIDSQHEVFRITDILVVPFHNIDQVKRIRISRKKLISSSRIRKRN